MIRNSANLSGGEDFKAALTKILAQDPNLLILDEITNNLDLETKDYITQILKFYPGAMIVISHDEEFLKAIDLTDVYDIKDAR